jgi:hypothetical protein
MIPPCCRRLDLINHPPRSVASADPTARDGLAVVCELATSGYIPSSAAFTHIIGGAASPAQFLHAVRTAAIAAGPTSPAGQLAARWHVLGSAAPVMSWGQLSGLAFKPGDPAAAEAFLQRHLWPALAGQGWCAAEIAAPHSINRFLLAPPTSVLHARPIGSLALAVELLGAAGAGAESVPAAALASVRAEQAVGGFLEWTERQVQDDPELVSAVGLCGVAMATSAGVESCWQLVQQLASCLKPPQAAAGGIGSAAAAAAAAGGSGAGDYCGGGQERPSDRLRTGGSSGVVTTACGWAEEMLADEGYGRELVEAFEEAVAQSRKCSGRGSVGDTTGAVGGVAALQLEETQHARQQGEMIGQGLQQAAGPWEEEEAQGRHRGRDDAAGRARAKASLLEAAAMAAGEIEWGARGEGGWASHDVISGDDTEGRGSPAWWEGGGRRSTRKKVRREAHRGPNQGCLNL